MCFSCPTVPGSVTHYPEPRSRPPYTCAKSATAWHLCLRPVPVGVTVYAALDTSCAAEATATETHTQANGTITSPSKGGTRPVRNGTEPGTFASAMKPIMPICARRPLLISASRPLAFFSGEFFAAMPNGSYRSSHHCAGMFSNFGYSPGRPPRI